VEQKEAVKLKKHYRATCEVTEAWKAFLESLQDGYPHYIIKDVIPNTPHPVIKEWITKIMGTLPTPETEEEDERELITLHLEILTGRTHQIRYHLSSLWLPIVGDYLYNPNHTDDSGDKLQLTSFRLEFHDMDGKMRVCEVK
jgi:23S rRNA-/tRNA-specific pseudouridylate synthase